MRIHMSNFRRHTRKGFSLVEIILVVLILSVIAGLTIPNFSNTYKKFQLQRATRDLAYLMRFAQSRAIMKNLKVKLEFNSNLSEYWLLQQRKNDALVDNIDGYENLTGRFGKKNILSDKISIEIENPIIYFFPDQAEKRLQ